MADKLQVWNQALIHLGSAPIASVTATDVHSVNVFNNAWPGVTEEAFNEGDWNFAKRTVELSPTTGTASAGFDNVFNYPADYERTIAVCPESRFQTPFYDFRDEAGQLHANVDPLYLRYIRSDLTVDASIPSWPTMFWRFVAAKLAYETCERITQSTTGMERLERMLMKALRKAKSVDARNEPGKQIPTGSWNRARSGIQAGRGQNVQVSGQGEIVLGEGDV